MIEKELQLDILKKVLSHCEESADIFIESRKITSLVIQDPRNCCRRGSRITEFLHRILMQK
jgi:hypothetical protein